MFHSRKNRRQPAARNRKPIRLMLESLEQRLTPSGPQTAGSYGDLVNAVAADTAANTNYVIQITGNFQFNSGAPVIISKLASGSTLTIEGQNGTNYTLTGNGSRLFTVTYGQNVTFENLTLTGGSVTNTSLLGGSVTNSRGNAQGGDVDVSRVGAQGGALLDQGGDVTLSKVIVQGNTVKGHTAQGGGVYASGAGTLAIRDSILTIRDSILRDNSAQGTQGSNAMIAGANGAAGGSAYGGGLYVAGSGWTVTLIGDTFSGNTAIGGKGGNGAAGSNATAPNTSGGNGGIGGGGGNALGGAAYFSVSNGGSGDLAILNDLGAPLSDPSTMIGNSAQAGSGGDGGNGGNATGTAYDGYGGVGGSSGDAEGGALYVSSATGATLNVNIGNSAFYANKAASGIYGAIGLPPPQSASAAPLPSPPAPNPPPPFAAGGGLALGDGNITMVNSTVAKNTAINTAVAPYMGGAAPPPYFYLPGPGLGGGIYDNDAATVVLDNNTITQNTVSIGYVSVYPFSTSTETTTGAGVYVASGDPTLVNNLIQGNQNSDSSASDMASDTIKLSNVNNNFIGAISTGGINAINTSTNIVGNTQVQLGSVAGVDAKGNLTGGPIYYPLLPGVVSIGAGSPSVLHTIAGVEGTTPANAVDAIGNPRSSDGSIDLGAVQVTQSPPPSPPSPPPAPPALNVPPLLAFLDSLFRGIETVNANGTETMTDRFLGIPLLVSAFDSHGDLMSVDLFGFFNITFLFV